MSLFEVVLQSQLAGQECINRWNYLGSGTPAAVSLSFGLAAAMGFIADPTTHLFPSDSVFNAILNITSVNVTFLQVICMNVFDPTDFYTTALPSGTVGANAVEAAATFLAAGFRTNLVNRDIARGTKRFAGVPKTAVGFGNQLATDYIALMDTLAARMSAPITYDDEGNTLTYVPAIVQKEQYTTPRGKKAYKYYPSLTVQLSHIAQGFAWESYKTARSQTSRQLGKGA